MTEYTQEQSDFLRACQLCENDAKADGRVRFVNRRDTGFIVSGDGGDYLLKVYPGGRKILSVQGKELMGL